LNCDQLDEPLSSLEPYDEPEDDELEDEEGVVVTVVDDFAA
jgi:hypothetical protein